MYIYYFLDLLSNHSWSAAYQAAQTNWRFDPISFVIGFVVAFILVALIYHYRAQIAQQRDRVKGGVEQLRQRLTANMATRYSASVIEAVQTMHLLGAVASLDQIYVPIQLHAPLAPVPDEGRLLSLTPRQAIQAHDRLVIIGQLGSGRTTLLSHILLLQANWFHAARERERAPIYVYLPFLMDGKNDDDTDAKVEPVERLMQAAAASMPQVITSGLVRWLRGQIESGNALILLDGWDEVSSDERPAVTDWIRSLVTAHPANRLVLTAGERGYAPLIEAGFIPLRPIPWTRRQLSDLTQRWIKVWPFEDEGSLLSLPRISYLRTPPTPLAATVELAIQLRGLTPGLTPAERMAQLMSLLLPTPDPDDRGRVAWPLKTGYSALGRLALTAIENGWPILEREAIQSTVTEALPPSQFALDEEQGKKPSREEAKATQEEKDRRELQVVDCCRALTGAGAPIRSSDDRRYFFIHPLIAAYWAAYHLATEAGVDGVMVALAHVDDPAWHDVLRFYVGLASAGPLVEHLLSMPGDLFMSHLWAAADLLAAAPPATPSDHAPWRQALIKRLAQLFMNPRLPAFLHDRALTALIESGEAGVRMLFQRAANHPDPYLRAGAIMGLGALGREEDIGLMEAALADQDLQVQLAAANALGHLSLMGNRSALELVVAAMIEAEGEAQRAAAEVLAELGPEGHEMLREGAEDKDIVVRRAAIYGLAAIGEPWTREILEKMRQDDEWLIRNAAIQALANMDAMDAAYDERPTDDESAAEIPSLDLALPQPQTEPWLIAWAAERGEGTGTGAAAMATLMRALVEGDVSIRQMAVETLGRLADARTVDTLRQSLRDPEPLIREAALVALDEIGRRHDMVIPLK